MSMETHQKETTINLLEDIKSAGTKYNFKELLEEQNTHDLICPNCRSCITRRAIFKERREVPRSRPNIHLPQDRRNDGEPEVLRCSSCFSFFIPTEIFRFFERRREAENVPETVPAAVATENSPCLSYSDAPEKFDSEDLVIVEIERAPASQTTVTSATFTDAENPPHVDTQPLQYERRTAEVPEARDFDILKSIVYGGLIESITSLGVVSSAAGGGASTSNTLALALANLIAGLFVLFHNLRELKNEQSRGAQTQSDMEGDRYYQQLGKRGKFSLHLSIAVVSYLVFGLVAPITYGFSFRKSDSRDYKLAAVAASSLLCILLLALGKAHVRSKSYIKTALYYLAMGFVASGISFLVGELVDRLLKQLGLFDSGLSSISVSGGLRGMSLLGSGWASH